MYQFSLNFRSNCPPFSLTLNPFAPHFHKTLDPIGSIFVLRAESRCQTFDEVPPWDYRVAIEIDTTENQVEQGTQRHLYTMSAYDMNYVKEYGKSVKTGKLCTHSQTNGNGENKNTSPYYRKQGNNRTEHGNETMQR